MGPKYQGLRAALDEAARDDRHVIEFSFAEVDALVGGLPPSARTHRPWWANGGHSQSEAWRSVGWKVEAVDLRLQKVRFARQSHEGVHTDDKLAAMGASIHAASRQAARSAPSEMPSATPSVLLIGCVKSKLSVPSPAKDLYTSPLFARRREYAELSMKPWFILSSQWGLIDPEQIVAPYDMYLADQPASYRQAWGAFVVEQLHLTHPIMAGSVIEIHAGGAYVAAVQRPLESKGLIVTYPVKGTSIGRILQWYTNANHKLGHTE